MISRRQYLYHSMLNAVIVGLAFAVAIILTITRCAGPEEAMPGGGKAVADAAHVKGVQLAGRGE